MFFLGKDEMAERLLELIPANVLETTFGGEADPTTDIFAFPPEERDVDKARARIISTIRPQIDQVPPKHQVAVSVLAHYFCCQGFGFRRYVSGFRLL